VRRRRDIVAAIKSEERAVGQVIVRNLDDEVIEAHRRRAKARGVSLEQELRDVLRRAARPTGEERVRRATEIAALTPTLPPGRKRTPAEALIREGREGR
jgi:plasmid stability protein